jgi:proteic killer suppression protein
MSIQSFGDQLTRDLFEGTCNKETIKIPDDLRKRVRRKLFTIDYAQTVSDLRAPPGNNLEKKVGNLQEFWSIKVNAQWRIIFKWLDDGPHDVKFTDYH